jgi:hypothetical protein
VRYYLTPPPLNPFTRVIAALLAVAALVGAFFFGLVILALAVGLGILGWLALTLRLWWLRRQHGAHTGPGPRSDGGDAPGRGGDVIDGEYKVVSRDEDDQGGV